jgi:hypothetical protein
MNTILYMFESGLAALLQLLTQPFYYIAVLFIILQYRRQISLERKLYHVRLHSLINEVIRVIFWGCGAGVIASIAMAFIGIQLSGITVILLWGIALLLSFIRVRFLCFAYAAGILGLCQLILSWFSLPDAWSNHSWIMAVTEIHLPSLLALVAILHGVEALLIRLQGSRIATPIFIEGKRGKIIGGYDLQGFWPVPLMLLLPISGQGFNLPWTPLFAMEHGAAGWMFIGFPVLIGFSEMTTSKLPARKVQASALMLAYYSFALLALAILSYFWSPLVWLAVIASIAMHEAVIWYSAWSEERQTPLYVHDERGLRILAVVPGSAAQELEIEAGEIIHRINGVRIQNKEQLHEAMGINSAFCRLEILNNEGHNKFLKRALFAGEHHELGMILAPDEKALYYMEKRQLRLMHMVKTKLYGLLRRDSSVSGGSSDISG